MAGGVEQNNQRGDGIESYRYKAAFYGQGALSTLPSPLRLLLHAHAVVKVQPGGNLVAENFKQAKMLRAELARPQCKHGQCADNLLLRIEDGNSGKGAAWFRAFQLDASRRETRVVGGIVNQQWRTALNSPVVGSLRTRLVGGLETMARLEPKTI